MLRVRVPLLHHRVSLHCMRHSCTMCDMQCRALCCVVAGTKALLSLLLFRLRSWRSEVRCSYAKIPGGSTCSRMGYTVSAACCPWSVSRNRRDASTAVHARRMPQTKWNNDLEMGNGIQQRSVQQNYIIDVVTTAVHCQYFAVLL